MGQKGVNIVMTDLAKVERILPILHHPNESFRYQMTQFIFNLKK